MGTERPSRTAWPGADLSKDFAQRIQGPALGTADHSLGNKERNPGGWGVGQ